MTTGRDTYSLTELQRRYLAELERDRIDAESILALAKYYQEQQTIRARRQLTQ